MRKSVLILSIFLASILILSACTKQIVQPAAQQKTEKIEPVEQPIEKPKVEQAKPISPEVQDLLSKHKTKISSVFYKYKGPETGEFLYDFYLKDKKMKYSPIGNQKFFDERDSYNYIFIDSESKTARSYCLDVCRYLGKKGDLNYDDASIPTLLDWIEGITVAEKVGEEVIDDRSTWKLDTNKGTIWVDTFYGIPLKVESGGKTYRFQQVAVNSVQDSDVVPS